MQLTMKMLKSFIRREVQCMTESRRRYDSVASIMRAIEELADRVNVPDDDATFEAFQAKILETLEEFGTFSTDDAQAFKVPQAGYMNRR